MTDLLEPVRSSDRFIGRRAILDADLQVHAYELLHRHAPGSTREDVATELARIASQGNLATIASGRPVWLPATSTTLGSGFTDELDAQSLVLEVAMADLGSADTVARLRDLRARGARVAVIDDADAPVAGSLPSTVDLLRVNGETLRPVDLAGRLQGIRNAGVKLMADDVRTHARRRWLEEAGVDLFEGVFLTEPDIGGVNVPSSRLATLRLIAELDRDEIAVDEVENLVSQDVALSYQILRYVNSAFVGLRAKVSSIRQAVVLLGPPTVRQIAAVALLGSDDKPIELIRTALVRAKLCEGLAKALKEPPSSYYTAGLFSSLEAMTDLPLAAVLDELPLTEDVREAIQHRTGPIGRAIRAAIAHERCDWDDPALAFFTDDALSESYFTAITWVDEILTAIAED